MKKLFLFLSKERVLLVLLGILSLVLLISLPNRALQSDENWFGEQAYWLLNEGTVRLKSIPLIFNWDEEMLVHHKLLTWSGAVIIYVFGWSVYPLRLFILALSIFTFFIMWKWVTNSTSTLKKKHFLLGMMLLLTTPEFIIRIFFFRPEVLVMCFGFISFYFFYQFEKQNKNHQALLAGFFAGLAFLSHLTAVIFPVAGFLILMFKKRWKGLLVYSIICFSICMIYTESLWSQHNLNQYLFELKNWPSHSFEDKVEGGLVNKIWNNLLGLLDEHKRYFWDQDIWLISGMFFLSLLFHWRYIKSKEPLLLSYTIILLVLMGLVNGSHGPRYLVYVFPFMTLIISMAIYNIWTKQKIIQQVAFLIIFSAQLTILTITYSKIFKSKTNIAQYSNRLLSDIPEGSDVIGPWNLIYNNIDNYNLFNFKSYEYIEERKAAYSQEEILKSLRERNIQFIILDGDFKESGVFHWFPNWELRDNRYYEYYSRSKDHIIYKKSE